MITFKTAPDFFVVKDVYEAENGGVNGGQNGGVAIPFIDAKTFQMHGGKRIKRWVHPPPWFTVDKQSWESKVPPPKATPQ